MRITSVTGSIYDQQVVHRPCIPAAFRADFLAAFRADFLAGLCGAAGRLGALGLAAGARLAAGGVTGAGAGAGGYSIGNGSIQPEPDQPISI